MRLRLLLLVSLLVIPDGLPAQLEPPSTGGLAALDQALRPLARYQRVLMIAAHPDDEDTELLTLLVRGMGSEAGYLSLTRGEGGQNLIGSELGEALGLVRTGELLAARRLDGAHQFFSRAYDFGFSKNLDDTWAHWPRDSVLKDVVRIVRRFRPQVVVSIFSGTSRDGHGQHQAAGWAAREAFRLAGDSAAFPELVREEALEPWAPAKLYRSTRFDSSATTLQLDGGVLDPATGQSYHQIAMRGRSLHRSQDMGQLQRLGPSTVRLRLIEDRTGGNGDGIFAGLDTTLAGVPLMATVRAEARRGVTERLGRYRARVDSARTLLAPALRPAFQALLARAEQDLDEARRLALDGLPGARGRRVIGNPVFLGDPFEGEARRLSAARMVAQDLVLDGVSEDQRVTPGQRVGVTLSVWNPGTTPADPLLCVGSLRFGWSVREDSVRTAEISRSPRRGACLGFDTGAERWRPLGAGAAGAVPPGRLTTARLVAEVRESEDYTTPYFLRAPRAGDLYTWDPDERWAWGEPFGETTWWFEAQLGSGDRPARDPREVTFRGNDQATGEFRRPVVVVPRLDVRLEPASDVRTLATRQAWPYTVTLVHGARDSTSGVLELRLPEGWAQPPAQRFSFSREDQRQTFTFKVQPPAGLRPGQYQFRAVAIDERGRRYDVGMETVDHPHIQPRTWSQPAVALVHVAALTLPRLTAIGYVRGAADLVPEALMRVGLPVTLLTGADLQRASLTKYQAIVVGPRAFETDPDLPAANARLLAFARGGGTVIVQYQQYGYFLGGYAPFDLTVGSRAPGTPNSSATPTTRRDSAAAPSPALLGGHDRVTDETANVKIIYRHPVVLRPNLLGPTDWEGWVQERGLYFARSWGPEWATVLQMRDPGEPLLEGGLLISRTGKGTYVYTGLSFFRQLPAGVPGAYRLFANLLALGERPAAPRPARAPADTVKLERE